jgi:hypothetical protein
MFTATAIVSNYRKCNVFVLVTVNHIEIQCAYLGSSDCTHVVII